MLKKLILAVSLCLISTTSFAVREQAVPSQFMQQLLPWVLSNYKQGSFQGVDNVKINYYFREVQDPKGVLIISPGQTESSLKYSELLWDLKDWGYSIYIIDHRGQGLSGRLLPDGTKSHVNRFQDYVDDFSYFVTNVVKSTTYKNSVIIAHSMGGGIASGFLNQHAFEVKAAVLSSPMLEINTGFFGALGADILANILTWAGRGDDLAPQQKPYNPNSPFEGNTVTSSRNRYQMKIDLYKKYPALGVGGATVNWVREALEFTTALRQKDNVYSVPTLMFNAGKDQIVTLHGESQTCKLSPDTCHLIGFPTAQHEILMEQDSIRDLALQKIKAFVQNSEVK